MAAAGRAPGGGYGGARARARARGSSCRVQMGRRGALPLVFIFIRLNETLIMSIILDLRMTGLTCDSRISCTFYNPLA